MTTDRIATLEDMQGAYSDLYKDVYGFRPRGCVFWDNYEALGAEIEYLYGQLERVIAEEKEREEQCVKAFEQRVLDTIALGAGTRETAIRWIAEGVGYADPDFICYEFGLPYGYLGREYLYKETVDAE